MILGGYTFPWRPEKATIPRGERGSAWAKGLGVLGYLAESSILQPKEILLEWNFVSAAQWDAMMTLYRADQLVEWDPYYPMAGGTPSGVPGAEYGYAIGEAVHHGWVVIDAPPYIVNQLTVGQNMYCSNRNDGGATVVDFVVTESGPNWFRYRMDPRSARFYQLQPGELVSLAGSPYSGGVVPIFRDEPYRTACMYPDPTLPLRLWYRGLPSDPGSTPPGIGDIVYSHTPYMGYNFEVTALGSGYVDVVPYEYDDPQLSELKIPGLCKISTWDYPFWYGQALLTNGLALPMDVPPGPAFYPQYGPEHPGFYNVRITSLFGELFPVAGYEQPYRQDVKMKLLLRGVA